MASRGGEVNLTQRCRMFVLGVVLWTFVVLGSAAHLPFSDMGLLHAALASMVAASAFLPRRSLYWS